MTFAVGEPPNRGPGADGEPPWLASGRAVLAWLKAAPRGPLLELCSRLGYAARATIYLNLGALAVLVAVGLAPRVSGAVEAMERWGRWPAGLLLIWLTGLGLWFFTLWRFCQAWFDADRHGRSPRGIAARAGQAISGVAHAILAYSTWEMVDGLGDLGEAEDPDAAQALAQTLLAVPHGDVLLTLAGVTILAFAAGSIGQGLLQNFARRLDCSPRTCRWAVRLARFGYVMRGLAVGPVGVFLVRAGLEARASAARDFDGALQLVGDQPFGRVSLAVAGLGLAAFGLFAIFEALWRRIDPRPTGVGSG